jgi:hypothetical protein
MGGSERGGGIPLGDHPGGFRVVVGLVSTFTTIVALVAWRCR